MNLPAGVQVSLLINSNGGAYNGSYQCKTIADAFDNSWVPK
jgi:hypothetical protein